jgi:hypothetical protein
VVAKRLIELAVKRGHDVNVFSYKGEPCQAPTSRPAQAASSNDELSRDWIAGLMHQATTKGVKVDWVACTPREEFDPSVGIRCGSHADFWDMAAHSHNMLVVPSELEDA